MLKNSLVGKSVFDKRSGLMGKVLSEDSLTLGIEVNGVNKTVTHTTFKRWYRVIEDETSTTPVNEKTDAPIDKSSKVDIEKPKVSRCNPSGEKGVGEQLCQKFLYYIKDMANQDLDITTIKKGKYLVIKYNGKNAFECAIANRRISVFCHPKSLTPYNLQRVTRMFPNKNGWYLCAKYVFTSLDESPLMKSIITDGLYYRRNKEE